MHHSYIIRLTLRCLFCINIFICLPLSSSENEIIHINTCSKSKYQEGLSFHTIKNNIINHNKSYLITQCPEKKDIKYKTQNETSSSFFDKKSLSNMGFKISSDRYFMSNYKNSIMFTPYPTNSKINITDIINNIDQKKSQHPTHYKIKLPEQASLPHISFYFNIFRPITNQECLFPKSHVWNIGNVTFCNNANISLIYRVNLERSLQYGTTGSATPDAKIVRISLDDESGGAGIHLNEYLTHRENKPGYTGVNSWYKDWSTDAYAQRYMFNVESSNNKAVILKTFPESNINPGYEKTVHSGFSLGISAELGKDGGPKALLIPQLAYEQSHALSYNTQEYAIKKSNTSNKDVAFIWDRREYSDRDSLLNKQSSTIFDHHITYPIDETKINSIAYSNFSPKFDVIYIANIEESGKTNFTLSSTTTIRPLYSGGFLYFYLIGAHIGYETFNTDHLDRNITTTNSFTVNWDHPVFTGGHPVNIQLGGGNNHCLSYHAAPINTHDNILNEINKSENSDEQTVDLDTEDGYLNNIPDSPNFNSNDLKITTCDLKDKRQSFIYDSLTRYRSVVDINLCLDANNLSSLTTCNNGISQRWEWLNDSDFLVNKFNGLVFTHNILNEYLLLSPIGALTSDSESQRTLTNFTTLFHNN